MVKIKIKVKSKNALIQLKKWEKDVSKDIHLTNFAEDEYLINMNNVLIREKMEKDKNNIINRSSYSLFLKKSLKKYIRDEKEYEVLFIWKGDLRRVTPGVVVSPCSATTKGSMRISNVEYVEKFLTELEHRGNNE